MRFKLVLTALSAAAAVSFSGIAISAENQWPTTADHPQIPAVQILQQYNGNPNAIKIRVFVDANVNPAGYRGFWYKMTGPDSWTMLGSDFAFELPGNKNSTIYVNPSEIETVVKSPLSKVGDKISLHLSPCYLNTFTPDPLDFTCWGTTDSEWLELNP